MYFDYIYGFGCIYIISVTADPLAPAKLIICSVFDVPALSEVVKEAGRRDEKREDREQKNKEKQKQPIQDIREVRLKTVTPE